MYYALAILGSVLVIAGFWLISPGLAMIVAGLGFMTLAVYGHAGRISNDADANA